MMRITKTVRLLLGLFSILILAFSFTTGPQQTAMTGKELYAHNCQPCHGSDGTKGLFGAKNLRKSVLGDSAIVLQIQNGKKIMPSFRKRLTMDEIQQLVLYIKSLRET